MEQVNVLFCNIIGFDWEAIIKIIIGVWAVGVATHALNTWKRQAKAERKANILDEITETTYTYINQMYEPTERVRYINIVINSFEEAVVPNQEHSGKVKYVLEHGKEDAKGLSDSLQHCTASYAKLGALINRAKALGFIDFPVFHQACMNMFLVHRKSASITTIIGNTNLNWENPKVKESLDNLLLLDADGMGQALQTSQKKILEFSRVNYESIYK
jgi:hypothetical protein